LFFDELFDKGSEEAPLQTPPSGEKRQREESTNNALEKRQKHQSSLDRFFGSSRPASSPSSIVDSTTRSHEVYAAIHGIPLRNHERIDLHSRCDIIRQPGDGDCWYHVLAFHLDIPTDPVRL
jgi:hypothetical protein